MSRVKVRRNDGMDVPAGCGAILLFLALNATIGALLFQYCLWSIFGKDIPWYGDVVAGLVLAQIALPVALTCWIVRLCGVAVPFIT